MATQTKRNYNRKKAKSLADIDTKRILKDLDKPISVLVGLAAGVPIAMIVEKAVGRKSTVSGLFGIDGTKLTRILKPAVNIALGMSVHQLAKNPKIKLAGIGLAANGGIIAMKDFLGKDILKGISDGGLGNSGQQPPARVIERAIERNSSRPLDLPVLEIDEPGEEVDNYIENVVAGPATKIESVPEEQEIILSSDRPEDNFENEPEISSGDDEFSGDIESGSGESTMPVTRPVQIEKDVEEELDFTDIP
jgi:hypothetical protein